MKTNLSRQHVIYMLVFTLVVGFALGRGGSAGYIVYLLIVLVGFLWIMWKDAQLSPND